MTALASDDDDDARPSLIADWQHDPAPQGSGLRMLSGLESAQPKGFGRMPVRGRRPAGTHRQPEPSVGRRSTRWWLRGLLLSCCVLIGGVYVWFVVNQADTAPTPLQTVTAAARPVSSGAAASTAARIEAVTPVARGADANPFHQLESPVVAVAVPVPVPASASQAGTAAPFSSLDGLDPHTAGHWKASRQAAEAASNAEAAAKVAATGLVPGMDVAKPPASAAASTPAPPLIKQTAAQKRKAAREADAALLSALVAHVSAHSRGEVNGAMPPVRLTNGKAPPMTTIAQIVGYCRSLSGEEAKQCRVRICESYWGKDDACSTRPAFHRAEAH